jgi:hypothetical protein
MGSRADLPARPQAIRAGIEPDRPLEAYRNGSLRVASLAAAAWLTVCDDNRGTPRFVKYHPPACGPAASGGLSSLRARKLATVPFCEGGWCRLASSTTWSP